MITKFKCALAGMAFAFSIPAAGSAAVITDSDPRLGLGGEIDVFSSASLTEVFGTKSIVGANATAAFAADNTSGAFAILYGPLPVLAGVELKTFGASNILEILFNVEGASSLAPSRFFLLEFVASSPIVSGSLAPTSGSATLYQVASVPLPANLPLLLTTLGLLSLLARKSVRKR